MLGKSRDVYPERPNAEISLGQEMILCGRQHVSRQVISSEGVGRVGPSTKWQMALPLACLTSNSWSTEFYVKTSLNKTHSNLFNVHFVTMPTRNLTVKPLVIEGKARKRANTRTESAKIRNRRFQKKYNGTPAKPRLSVFCSEKQLYAMLVDDQNKKCLFYGSTLQKSIRSDPTFSTVEAAKVVGEELVKAAIDLNINEISSYDRNGFARGERIKAFEIAVSCHGFLPR
ncbi:hypothetical protein Nepgr_003567 [Nepenthes gracilis]|uniref:50S ribosomal protein L18, chloroplastic n=1 Tax=Nepenthes gracilis TaxID=150966 RepID=A0AAD3RZV5_NEPGR|nr:hypothetical protein Nepgr_003567 [Nepenthes gracilis]